MPAAAVRPARSWTTAALGGGHPSRPRHTLPRGPGSRTRTRPRPGGSAASENTSRSRDLGLEQNPAPLVWRQGGNVLFDSAVDVAFDLLANPAVLREGEPAQRAFNFPAHVDLQTHARSMHPTEGLPGDK